MFSYTLVLTYVLGAQKNRLIEIKYVLGDQKNGLIETVHLITHNICFG